MLLSVSCPDFHQAKLPAPSSDTHGGSQHTTIHLCPPRLLGASRLARGAGRDPCGQRSPAPCEGGDVRGWMSQDGERRAVPAPTCSAGLAQGGGTSLAPPTRPSCLGKEGSERRQSPQSRPQKAPLLAGEAGLDRGARMGGGHSSALALQQPPALTDSPRPALAWLGQLPHPESAPTPHHIAACRSGTSGWGGVLRPPEPSAMAGVTFGGAGVPKASHRGR